MIGRLLPTVTVALAGLLPILPGCGSEESPTVAGEWGIALFDEETTRVVLPQSILSRAFEDAFASGRVWVTEVVARKNIHIAQETTKDGKGRLWTIDPVFSPSGSPRRVDWEDAHDPQAGRSSPEKEWISPRDLQVGELILGEQGITFCADARDPSRNALPGAMPITYETRTEDILSRLFGSTPEVGSVPQPHFLAGGRGGTEYRRSVTVAAGTELYWRVRIPSGGRLVLGYGIEALGMRYRDGRAWVRQKPETIANFRVSLKTEIEAHPTVLWEAEVSPDTAGRYFDIDIDLESYADRQVEICLSASAPAGDGGSPPQTFPFWTEPVIRGERTAPPLNVVILLLDTLRADRLGCYGWERAQTPNLDALARRGVRFERAWCAAPWTLPSHASLFTSLHLSEHGVWHPDQRLPEGHVTIAEQLRTSGYSTTAFTEGGYVRPVYGLAQGFDRFTLCHGGFRAAGTFNRAWEWIREARTPFFCFIQTYEVHSPYNPPQDERERLVDPYSGELPESVDVVPYRWKPKRGIGLDAADLKYVSDLYDAEIASVDAAVGQFVENLRVSGLLENTLLIVTSDHGEEFADHGHLEHGWSLYEEQLRVPLLIFGQGTFDGGQVRNDAVHGIDLAPTIAAAVGVEAPLSWSGQAISPESPGDHPLFVPYRSRGAGNAAVALLHGTLKYIEFPNQARPADPHTAPMLFDLETDPSERTNLWSPDLGKEWSRRVERLQDRYGLSLDPDQAETNAGVNAALRALGYAGD